MSTTSAHEHSTTGELTAGTPAGAAMVAAVARLADEFTEGATAHDRDGTFAVEHLDKLRADGFLTAPVPAEFGGGDVSSVRDVLVACVRLARADPSTAIGVNMHFAVLLNMVRGWRAAAAGGRHATAKTLADGLRLVTAADVVFASAVSEPSPQDLTRPSTRAVRVDDGWVVDGRKVFATMGPAATVLSVAVTYEDDDCVERYGFVLVPVGSPGVVFHHDWDALGMRGSESGSVSFRQVRLGPGAVHGKFPVGTMSAGLLDRYLTSGAFHAAASLGIAESAHMAVLAGLRARAGTTLADAHAVVRLADNVVELTAMRASFDRAARLIDGHFDRYRADHITTEAAHDAYAEIQAAKAFITAAAVRVVDRAMALTGGAGYMAKHPLAKAWRDVRAGAFMHPLGANRVDEYLSSVALSAA
jgi:L-evernosamine nitrososynthase